MSIVVWYRKGLWRCRLELIAVTYARFEEHYTCTYLMLRILDYVVRGTGFGRVVDSLCHSHQCVGHVLNQPSRLDLGLSGYKDLLLFEPGKQGG